MSTRKKVVITAIITSVLTFVLTLFFISGIFSMVLAANYLDLGNLREVVGRLRNDALQPVKTKTLVDGAIKGMVDSLKDPYTVYLEPKNYKDLNARIQGSFGGVGIVVEAKDRKIVVLQAIKGTPAEKAGIKSGDAVIKIDDKDTTGMDLDVAASLIRGEEGTKVKLVIARQGVKNPLEFILQRKAIEVPTVEGEFIKDTGIAHITISQFNSKTPGELDETIKKLQPKNMRAIILDLRDNPGGELISATEVAKNFVPKGPIVFIDNRKGRDEEYDADGSNIKLPLVVLVNEGSASAAEILAGAIKDTGSGELVGTKTFGKGVVQTIYELRNGAGLKLTTARYLTPKKLDINKKGITPDIVIQQPEHSEKDVQLDKAIEIINKKM